MATRAELHRLVEQLDDDLLPEALNHLLRMTNSDHLNGGDGLAPDELSDDEDNPDDFGEPITAEDSLWRIIGIGSSAEPTDVRNHKDEYLAEAYSPRTPRT